MKAMNEMFVMEVGNNDQEFCKTLGKPYDVVVCCVSLRASMLAPGCIKIGYV